MEDEIKKLLEKNLELTEEIYKMVKGIKKYIFWQKVFSFLKILIIVVPIIIGIIYLPPLLKRFSAIPEFIRRRRRLKFGKRQQQSFGKSFKG